MKEMESATRYRSNIVTITPYLPRTCPAFGILRMQQHSVYFIFCESRSLSLTVVIISNLKCLTSGVNTRYISRLWAASSSCFDVYSDSGA